MGAYTHIDLDHLASTMAWNAIIMGRNITEQGVCGKILIEPTDIGSREASFIMLLQPVLHLSPEALGSMLQSARDSIRGHPIEELPQRFEVRFLA